MQEPIRHDSGIPVWMLDEKQRPICGAELDSKKVAGDPFPFCRVRSPYLMANGRCLRHAKWKSSPENGQAKTSEVLSKMPRSEVIFEKLPGRLREVFKGALQDQNKLSHENELAIMDTHIYRLLEMLQDVPDPVMLTEIKQEVQELNACLEAVDDGGLNRSVDRLESLLSRGSNEHAVWAELLTAAERRVKVADAETKRVMSAKLSLNAREAENMILIMFRVLCSYITDPFILNAIREDFKQQLGYNSARMALEAPLDDERTFVVEPETEEEEPSV